MAKKFWSRPVAVLFGLTLLALLGFALLSQAAVEGGEADEGWLARVHQHLAGQRSAGHGMHHGMRDGLHHFIEDLDLSEEQQGHLETFHRTLFDGLTHHGEGRLAQRDQLVTAIETGTLSVVELEGLIDDHADALKRVAYEAAEPLAALINSFDEEQRVMMVDHIRALHGESE